MKTQDYVQITGTGDFTRINIRGGDAYVEVQRHIQAEPYTMDLAGVSLILTVQMVRLRQVLQHASNICERAILQVTETRVSSVLRSGTALG